MSASFRAGARVRRRDDSKAHGTVVGRADGGRLVVVRWDGAGAMFVHEVPPAELVASRRAAPKAPATADRLFSFVVPVDFGRGGQR